jgi:hypothetical protein
MRRVSWVAGVLLLGVAAVSSAQTPLDAVGWKTLREEALGFELKHPPTWRPGRSTGTLESVFLGEPAEVGAARVSMQVFVQRGINPGGLSVDRWYDDQLKRLNVTSAPPITTTTIGGRRTIRREMSRPDSRRYDFYTAINAADIFQVSITRPASETRLDRAHEAVLSTIVFLK